MTNWSVSDAVVITLMAFAYLVVLVQGNIIKGLRKELHKINQDTERERQTRKGLQAYLDDVRRGKAPAPKPFAGEWGKPEVEAHERIESILANVRKDW